MSKNQEGSNKSPEQPNTDMKTTQASEYNKQNITEAGIHGKPQQQDTITSISNTVQASTTSLQTQSQSGTQSQQVGVKGPSNESSVSLQQHNTQSTSQAKGGDKPGNIVVPSDIPNTAISGHPTSVSNITDPSPNAVSSPSKTRKPSGPQDEVFPQDYQRNRSNSTSRQTSMEPQENKGHIQKTDSLVSETGSTLASTDNTWNRQKPAEPMDFENLKQKLNQLKRPKKNEGPDAPKTPGQAFSPAAVQQPGVKNPDVSSEDPTNQNYITIGSGSGSDTALQNIHSHNLSIQKAQSQPVLNTSLYGASSGPMQNVLLPNENTYQASMQSAIYSQNYQLPQQQQILGSIAGMTSPPIQAAGINQAINQYGLTNLMGSVPQTSQTQLLLGLIQNQIISQQQQQQQLTQALIALLQHQLQVESNNTQFAGLIGQHTHQSYAPAMQMPGSVIPPAQTVMYQGHFTGTGEVDSHESSPRKTGEASGQQMLQNSSTSSVSQSPQHTMTSGTTSNPSTPVQLGKLAPGLPLMSPAQLLEGQQSQRKKPERPPDLKNLEQALIEKLHTGAKKNLFPGQPPAGGAFISGLATQVINPSMLGVSPSIPVQSVLSPPIPGSGNQPSPFIPVGVTPLPGVDLGLNTQSTASTTTVVTATAPVTTTMQASTSAEPTSASKNVDTVLPPPSQGKDIETKDKDNSVEVKKENAQEKDNKAANKSTVPKLTKKRSRFSVTIVKDDPLSIKSDAENKSSDSKDVPAKKEEEESVNKTGDNNENTASQSEKQDKVKAPVKKGRFQVTTVKENKGSKMQDNVKSTSKQSEEIKDHKTVSESEKTKERDEIMPVTPNTEMCESVATTGTAFMTGDKETKEGSAVDTITTNTQQQQPVEKNTNKNEPASTSSSVLTSSSSITNPVSVTAATSSAVCTVSSNVSNTSISNTSHHNVTQLNSGVEPHLCSSRCLTQCRHLLVIKENDSKHLPACFASDNKGVLASIVCSPTFGSYTPLSLLSEYSTTSLSPDHLLETSASKTPPLHNSPVHFEPISSHQRTPYFGLETNSLVRPTAKKSNTSSKSSSVTASQTKTGNTATSYIITNSFNNLARNKTIISQSHPRINHKHNNKPDQLPCHVITLDNINSNNKCVQLSRHNTASHHDVPMYVHSHHTTPVASNQLGENISWWPLHEHSAVAAVAGHHTSQVGTSY